MTAARPGARPAVVAALSLPESPFPLAWSLLSVSLSPHPGGYCSRAPACGLGARVLPANPSVAAGAIKGRRGWQPAALAFNYTPGARSGTPSLPRRPRSGSIRCNTRLPATRYICTARARTSPSSPLCPSSSSLWCMPSRAAASLLAAAASGVAVNKARLSPWRTPSWSAPKPHGRPRRRRASRRAARCRRARRCRSRRRSRPRRARA